MARDIVALLSDGQGSDNSTQSLVEIAFALDLLNIIAEIDKVRAGCFLKIDIRHRRLVSLPKPSVNNVFAQTIAAKGALAVLSNKPSHAPKCPLDKHLYAQRHLVECCCSRLKRFRRVVTRFKNTTRNDMIGPSSLSQPSSLLCSQPGR